MRFFKSILLMLSVVVSCTLACTKPDNGSEGAAPSINFKSNPVLVAAEAGNYTIEVTSSAKWTAAAQVDWISDVTASEEGDLAFSVSANPGSAFRDGKIRFSFAGSSYTKDLTVRQAAKLDGISTEVKDVKLAVSGTSQDINVTADSWSVKNVSEDWLEARKKNAVALTLSADVNFTGNERKATVTLTDGSEDLVLNVTQEHSDAYFKNATTVETRKLVYKLGTMVTNVTADSYVRVNDGLSYTHLNYSGPVVGSTQNSAFFMYEVDLTKNLDLLVTCAKDDDSSIKLVDTEITDKDIMRKQYADLQKNRPEIKVLGGVNGDFFFGEESKGRGNLLHGVMWRRGVCLKDTFDGGAACTVFAMMKDGTAKVMSQSDYAAEKSNIVEAVGARQRILENGVSVNTSDKTLEPRTAVGVSPDRKTVYLLVFDGRKTYWSSGANYDMMATIFSAFGANNATNLDGGGSSTFALLKTNAAGTSESDYNVLNKVSDGDDRKVVNGIAIVQK
jgi:hypothetical protein